MRTALLALAATASIALCSAALADTTVPVGHFHSVTVEGMGHITFVHGNSQRVVLKRGDTTNTEITVKDGGDLVFKSCPNHGMFGWNSSCPSGYELDVEITTPSIDGVEIDGSGKVETSGFPQQSKLSLEINGSGYVDLKALPAASVDVAIHGSGKVFTTAHDDLNVEIAGSGTVLYSGHPHINQTILGSGNVQSAP